MKAFRIVTSRRASTGVLLAFGFRFEPDRRSGAALRDGRLDARVSSDQGTGAIGPKSNGRRSLTRRLVTDRVGVLLRFFGRQVLRLALADAIEAGEGVHVAERMALEPLGEALLGQRPLVAERDGQIVDRLDGGAEGRAGDDRHSDAELLHLRQAEPWRHAGLVVEDRALHLATHAPHFLDARRPLDEREIGSRREVGVGAANRLVERAAAGAASVGAGDQDEVRVELAPNGVRRTILAHGFLDRDHAPAGHVAAPLGDQPATPVPMYSRTARITLIALP